MDIKQSTQGIYVIEVNDNPNMEAGVEDAVLKERLYHTLLGEFIARLDRRRLA